VSEKTALIGGRFIKTYHCREIGLLILIEKSKKRDREKKKKEGEKRERKGKKSTE